MTIDSEPIRSKGMSQALSNRAPSSLDNSAQWPIQDIVYTCIVGTIMLAALLKWLLWLLAFIYCLVQVWKKADEEQKWSTRGSTIVVLTFFTAMRLVFLPVMVVTLPLPSQIIQAFPGALVSSLQWFAFYTFASLLTLPWLVCVYQIVTHDLVRKNAAASCQDERDAPKVVIVMPCYNEETDVLLRTIESIVGCNYPSSCLHIYLSFDGDKVDDLYLNTIDKLGIPLTLSSYPPSIELTYQHCRMTVSRFVHGGKRHCQKQTFKLIDLVYEEYTRRRDDLFILFIDSDCILDKDCIRAFLYDMEMKPGSNRTVLAQTGVITSTTKKHSLITILQDIEYIHGQLFERTIESGCGAVTCLPGALTMFRFSAFRQVSKWYFANKAEQCNDLFDYGKMHLGEDRWLTHLFMISSTRRGQIQMNTGALCKTEAVQTFRSLLKQRRRWFLGFITNEAVMLTDVRLWTRYPFLMVLRLAQNTIRTTALLFFIMVISIITTSQKVANLPVGFIAVSLGLNWILMLYFGIMLRRSKMLLYPLMFVINPFFNWLYMVYAVFTASQRTWGGPRADASKVEEGKTAAEIIEQAEIAGGELNVQPESFKAAAASRRGKPPTVNSLMPPSRLAGRFKAANILAGGFFQRSNSSGVLGQSRSPRHLQRRNLSATSWSTHASSTSCSPARPHRLESIAGPGTQGLSQAQPTRQAHTTPTDVGATSPRRPISVKSETSDSYIRPHFVVPSRPILSSHCPSTIALPDLTLGTRQAAESASVPTTRRTDQSTTPFRRLSRRLGRSPLARKSFTHLAADQKTVRESIYEPGRRESQEESRGRQRRRPSVSVDPQGRRRLSRRRSR